MTSAALAGPGFDRRPLAANTGPFTQERFLSTWWETLAADDERLVVADDGTGLIAATLRGETLAFVGHEDVADYHSPLGQVTPELIDCLVQDLPPATAFRFDSLPSEAAEELVCALLHHTDSVERHQHQIAAVLRLPGTFDEYLASIGKKERHETRRKRRRFSADLGEPRLVRMEGEMAVYEFANMHRLSSGDKGGFMSDRMEAFFLALHERAGAVIDVLVGEDGSPVAAAFGFEDDVAYYLYNSAFDPSAGRVSPGVVLVSLLIERAIATGKTIFDFLKGDETYKFRLGASARPLYALEGRFGGGA